MELRTTNERTFSVALRAEGGWLGGSYAGEWGGGLFFVDSQNRPHTIQRFDDRYVTDIFALGDRYVALTGMAHLGSNYGSVYEIYLDGGKKWTAKPWRVLLKAPGRSWLVETGELFIDTGGGGSLLLSENGDFRMAECLNE